MKSITAALALAIATVAATSASASWRLAPHAGHEERQRYEFHHTQQNQYHTDRATARNSRASIARESGMRLHTHSLSPAHDVHVDGRYVGSDPDPFIRDTLRSEGTRHQR